MKKIVFVVYFILISIVGFCQNWERSNFFSSNDDISIDNISIDNLGNYYINGFLEGSYTDADTTVIADGKDIFLAKYDNEFNKIWLKVIGGTSNDQFPSFDLDDNNNLYIQGTFQGICKFSEDDSLIADFVDAFLVKYNSNGVYQWSKHLGSNSDIQITQSITVDKYGDIVGSLRYRNSVTIIDTTLTGRSGVYNNLLYKFDQNGNLKSVKNIISSSTSLFTSIKAFSDGYYIDGQFQDTLYLDNDPIVSTNSTKDIFLLKTDFDFNDQWVRRSYGNGDDFTGTITQDNYGNIYFTGFFNSDTLRYDASDTEISTSYLLNKDNSDVFIIKVNKSGNLIWLNNFGGKGSDWARTIRQKKDYLFLTGYFSDTLIYAQDTLVSSDINDLDIFMGYLDLEGNVLKLEDLKTSGLLDNDSGTDIIINDNNSIIISGYFKSENITIGDSIYTNSNNGFKESFLARYNPPLSSAFTKKTSPTCNGSTDGELVITPYFGVSPYTYDWSHDAELNDSTATGLTAGTYSVTVTDALDSTAVTQHTLTEPGPFYFNPSTTNVTTCSYSAEGAIDITVTGGNGGNNYTWSGEGTTPTAEDQTGLEIGAYSVTVTDSESCTADTTINITGPSPVIFDGSLVTDDSGPEGLPIGAVDLTVSGGTVATDYSYSWSSGETVQDISNKPGGNYTIIVTDDNSCNFDTTFNIKDLDTLYIYISDKKDDCTGGSGDGKATISYYTPNPDPVISYAWSTGGTDSTVTGLSPGQYFVTVTESDSSWTAIDSVEIFDLGYTINGNLSGTDSVDCKGDSDAFIDLTITSAGQTPYTYLWNNASTTQDLTNIPAGTYNVIVTDDNECTFISSDYHIGEPDLDLTATASIVSEPLCNGDLNGVIEANPNGGNGGYAYQWDDPASQTTQTADGLDANSYHVTITDRKGCQANANVNLTEPEILTIADALITDLTCYEGSNGAIDITVTGGTVATDYTYNWSTADGSGLISDAEDQTNIGAGTYDITVTDDNLCETDDSYIVTEPVEIVITDTVNADITTCNGDNTGAIFITASGGTGQLSYTLYPGLIQNTTGLFSGLAGGKYVVEVTDENDCGPAISDSILISEPAAITIDTLLNHVTCNGGVDGSIDITVTGGTVAADYSYNWSTADGSGLVTDAEDQTGLSAGTYDLTVTDDNGCEETTAITITEPTAIVIDETVSDITCNSLTDGSIDITVTGGTVATDYSYNWSTADGSGLVTGAEDQTGLGVGTYDLTVTDDNGCEALTSITINEPTAISIEETAVIDALCNGSAGGSIDITVTGGTVATDYTYNWSTADGSGLVTGAEDQTGLGAGTYDLTVTDDNGCEETTAITITEPTAIVIDETVSDITCNGLTDGSIDITVTGGTVATDYSYNWSTADGSGLVTDAEDQTGLGAGTYDLTVTDDNGCEETTSIVITEPEAITIVSETVTDATSSSATDGSIEVGATGGTGILNYLLTPGDISNETGIFDNLAPNDYTVAVTDENSCGPVTTDLTVSFPDAIESISFNKNIKLYPNPTSAKIKLVIDIDRSNRYTIEILSISGQRLYKENTRSDKSFTKELDLSNYAKGIYFIKVSTDQFYYQEKVILQ